MCSFHNMAIKIIGWETVLFMYVSVYPQQSVPGSVCQCMNALSLSMCVYVCRSMPFL